jgi:hypothetical protein
VLHPTRGRGWLGSFARNGGEVEEFLAQRRKDAKEEKVLDLNALDFLILKTLRLCAFARVTLPQAPHPTRGRGWFGSFARNGGEVEEFLAQRRKDAKEEKVLDLNALDFLILRTLRLCDFARVTLPQAPHPTRGRGWFGSFARSG